ncbi:MAG TPA: aspartate/glutamate racemase family protein [Pyrinomonadaceae bacterium]|jgi:aspartate racemase
MKILGLIGGTSWVSTIDYYRYINRLANERLGGLNYARILLYSLSFNEVKTLADASDWDALGELFSGIARNLENAGAEAIVLCANTTHIIAETVERSTRIPLIHIADSTAKEILKRNLKRVALLGTKFTMDNDFYKKRLAQYGIEAIIPNDEERDFIHDSIFEELGKDIFTAKTKRKYLEIIENLRLRGAEGVIFGCTEIPMLLKPDDCDIPSFDTTMIHARYAVDFALS